MNWDPSIGVVKTLEMLASDEGHVSLIKRARSGWTVLIAEPRWAKSFDAVRLQDALAADFKYVQENHR